MTFSTETWRICLPDDWEQARCSADGVTYLESGDKTKGIYVSTWNMAQSDKTILADASHFMQVSLTTLHRMPDREWQLVQQTQDCDEDSVRITADSFDAPRAYRVLNCMIGISPWLVRASFHDYNCTSHQDSVVYFDPIVRSLTIHHERE
jgi:hypothetical protein